MYLVITSESFPGQVVPIVSFDREETRDDAFMKARCLRDDAWNRGHEVTVEIHRLDDSSLMHRFRMHGGVASPSRKRGCRR